MPAVPTKEVNKLTPQQQEVVARAEAAQQHAPAPVAQEEPKGKKKRTVKTNGKQTEEVQQQPTEDFVDVARPVIYPNYNVEVCHLGNALTEANAKLILHWETQEQYTSRKLVESPGSDPKAYDWGEVYMLIDESGDKWGGLEVSKRGSGSKVQCWNNLDNRDFDEAWCRHLCQSILKFQWAGPLTIKDFFTATLSPLLGEVEIDGVMHRGGDEVQLRSGTINGSSVVVSWSGKVSSGQHSLIALILANQIYRKAPKGTYPEWDALIASGMLMSDGNPISGPVIETLLVTGASESPRVLMTTDYCKQRSEMDMLYTSELFQKYRLEPGKRKELSKMTAACGDLFWTRTDVKGYRTHPELLALLERHPKLIKAVEVLFELNSAAVRDPLTQKIKGGRRISNLRINPGQAACLLYEMGCSASDGDEYRNASPPREKGLDWSRWDDAKEFWKNLADPHCTDFEPIRIALGNLVRTEGDLARRDDPDNPGLGGSFTEKLAIIAKAWKVYVGERKVFTPLDLTEGGCLYLTYSKPEQKVQKLKNPDGTEYEKVTYVPAMLLEDAPDLGGIDVPDKKTGPEPSERPLTKEEQEARDAENRQRIEEETREKVRQMRLGQSSAPASPKIPTGATTAAPAPRPGSTPLRGGTGS